MTHLFDIQAVKAEYPLLQVVEAQVELKRSGRFWIGPCPFCGGRDRFNLRLDENGGGYVWLCRKCTDGRYQSALDYVMRERNLNVREALEWMANATGVQAHQVQRAASLPRGELPPSGAPPREWQEQARKIIANGMERLWAPQGERARQWLFARGLTEDDLLIWSLGYSPGAELGGVYVERGILIPCIEPDATGAERVWYIQVRRPIGRPKYRKIRGSGSGLFGAWTAVGKHATFVTEGEFDAMILYRALKSGVLPLTVGVFSPGSASTPVNTLDWAHALAGLGAIYVAYDNDQAGERGLARWRRVTRRVHRAPLPSAHNGQVVKDINDYLRAGGDVVAWARGIVETNMREAVLL